jgi:hypothetical protein
MKDGSSMPQFISYPVASRADFAGLRKQYDAAAPQRLPAEWNELRRRIVDTPGVDDVQIGAVSARSAEVTLRYPGGGQPLSTTLARQGLSLRNDGPRWLLRASFQ